MSLSSIFTIPTFLLAISINVLMLLIRRVFELAWPTLASHTPKSLAENIWERIALPTLPAVVGAIFCWVIPPAVDGALTGFSYPAVVTGTASRILYGVGTGFFSTYLYGVFKFLLKKEWNIDLPFPGDSTKPPPPEAVKPADDIPVVLVPPTAEKPAAEKPEEKKP
jgi:hypothetical protein